MGKVEQLIQALEDYNSRLSGGLYNITNTKKLNGIETVQAMEFTFYKKDRNNQNGYQTSFPHDLDRDNEHNQPTIVLPKSWFKN